MPSTSTLQQMPPRPFAALPILWALVILVLTLTPAADMPVTPEWELLAFDTAAHAGVFGLLAWLSWFSLRRQQRWPRLARHPEWTVLIGCFLFGGLIELLQSGMHMGRQGDVKDLIGDTIGAALALGIAWLLRSRIPAAPALLLLLCLGLSSHWVQAQDVAHARRTIEALASEKMHGRGYVQQGEHKAAAYLRNRFKELKLAPLAPNYTQPFTLDVNTFPGKISLSVGDSASGSQQRVIPRADFLVGQEFIAAANSAGSGHAVPSWCRLISLPDSATLASDVSGQQWLHFSPSKCALLLRPRDKARLEALPLRARQHCDSAAWVTLVPKLTASIEAQQAPNLRIELLETAWGRKYAGLSRAAVPVTLFIKVGLDVQLQRNYQTQNLAAVIRGTAQPDSFLVVSAHYDHLGMMGNKTYFPGANDNASGVALLLELAAHYARPENRPAYSVVFLLFGAEEAGLVGSQYFVAHPLVPLKSIKFLVNLDLLGTGEQGATVVNGRVFEAPYRRLVALNDAHHYLPQLAPRGRAANSDHYPFSEAGVPAFFIYTRGGSAAYHDVNDQPAALSLAGFTGAFGLVRDFMNELGARPN